MSELVEFLLARIDEDEARAQEAKAVGPIYWGDDGWSETLELARGEGGAEAVLAHCNHHDPARVLAECEAKRRIVDAWNGDTDDLTDGEFGGAYFAIAELAAVYATHPDYREEWRP